MNNKTGQGPIKKKKSVFNGIDLNHTCALAIASTAEKFGISNTEACALLLYTGFAILRHGDDEPLTHEQEHMLNEYHTFTCDA